MIIGSLRNAALVAVAALWLAGCASRVHSPFVPGTEAPRLVPAALRVSGFDYQRTVIRPSIESDGESADYWISSMSLPSVGENGQKGNLVTARYFKGKGPGAKPLVIVLPIWGKHTYPPNTITDYLRDRSGGKIDVLQVFGENTLFNWDAMAEADSEAEFMSRIDRMTGRMFDTVIDIRRLVDWAQLQPGVDPDRIALIGFSMGAIVGSLALAHEPRFGAGALVMGGADLHDAYAVCDTLMARARDAVTKRFGWTVDQFRDKLERPLAPINPASYGGMVDPRRVLIIEAADDSCLRAQGRERLWEAMGRPERISYLYDHKMAFMSMTFLGGGNLQKQFYRFLERTVLPDEPAVRYEADRPNDDRLGLADY